MLNIIGKKYVFLTFSGTLVTASIVLMIIFGFKPGIDFAGGTLWQFKANGGDIVSIKDLFEKDLQVKELTIVEEPSTKSFILRLPELDEKTHVQYLGIINKKFSNKVEELSYETIGPSVGRELRNKSAYAFLAVILTISLYIAFAFRKVSNPVKSWKYGVITLLTLFHDALIPLGMLAFLGWWKGVEMNTNFIVAILVVMGFSVHDTIVVFDRIRENLKLDKKSNFASLVNTSINETLARSINTSLTLVLVLVALFLLGSANLQYFILTILVGTIVGTYSSIFVASPLLTLWSR